MDVSGNREFCFDETWLDFLLDHLDRRSPIPIDIINVLGLLVVAGLKVDDVEVKALLVDEGMVNAVTSLLR